jgi:hypothetical protein
MGPKKVKSSVLTTEEEAMIVAFRKHTLLPLDDCLYALQETIPNLTRSSLHRCLKRHGINRLPDIEGEKEPKKKFKSYPIGFFHIDITEVRTEDSSKDFLEILIRAVPYKIHTVLTDNGIQFADLPKNRNGMTALLRGHPFDRVCKQNNIEHRLTKPNHPWTNGQVERINRTIKEATVNRYYYQNHKQLSEHLDTFILAYNFAKRLKTLCGITPYEFIVKSWTEEPKNFHLNLGLYI